MEGKKEEKALCCTILMTSDPIEPKHETSIHRLLRDAAFRLSPLTDGIMIKHQVEGTDGEGTLISSINTDINKVVQITMGGEISPKLVSALFNLREVIKTRNVPPILQTRALRQSALNLAIENARGYERAERATLGFERGTMTPVIRNVKIEGASAADIETKLRALLPETLKEGNLTVMHTGNNWKFNLTHNIPLDALSESDRKIFERITKLRKDIADLNDPIETAKIPIATNALGAATGQVKSHTRQVVKIGGKYQIYDKLKLTKFETKGQTYDAAIKTILKNAQHKGEVNVSEGKDHIFVTTMTPVNLTDLRGEIKDKVEAAGDAYEELAHTLSRVERPWLYIKRATEAERVGISEKTDAQPSHKPTDIPAITKLAKKLGAIHTGRRIGLWLDLDKDGATLRSEFRLSTHDVRVIMPGVKTEDYPTLLASRFNTVHNRAAGDSDILVEQDGNEWVVRTQKRFDHSNLTHAEHDMLKDTVRNYRIARDDSENIMFHTSPEIDAARVMASRLCVRLVSNSETSNQNIGFNFRLPGKRLAQISLELPEPVDAKVKPALEKLMQETYKLTGDVDLHHNTIVFNVKLKSAYNPALIDAAAESHTAFENYRKALVANSELQIGRITS